MGAISIHMKTFGHAPLDFSANINPFGMPQGVKDAIVHSLAKASAYPDPLCRDLCAGIAQSEGVQTHAVLCGNGAADLIWRLVWAQKPQYAMVLAPTFCEYEQALGAVGCG